MSTLKIDELKNNGSAIDLPNGIKVGGNEIVQGYTSSGTEPASPVTGDFWWDSTNELLYQYVNGEFKAIGVIVPLNWTVDLSNVTYDSVSYATTAQDADPLGVIFRPDGLKMYVVGNTNNSIYQYNVSTPFDLSTVSGLQVGSFSVHSQEQTPYDMEFNADGTKMYVVGIYANTIFQYSLTTAYDVTTASYDNVSFSVSSQESSVNSMAFNSDGTKAYILGNGNDTVYQYSLSTGFDLSTASYDSVSFSVASQENNARAMAFNTDGTKMYICGLTNDTVYQYSLSTGFNVSTASYDSVSFSVASQESTPFGMNFSADGTKMYIIGADNDRIHQYSTGL